MKGINIYKNPKVIPLSHPAANGGAFSSTSHRLWIFLLCLFSLASLLTLLSNSQYQMSTSPFFPATGGFAEPTTAPLSADLSEALIHYATFSNSTSRMPDADIHAVAAVVRRRAPCNLLVFGLGHEALLLQALNHNGRTVFLEEKEYHIQNFERQYPNQNIEAYDVSYTTKVSELYSLLADTRAQRRTDCRPVQNLLFSDCKLGINDLPNHLYDVSWDAILVDGPSGYNANVPGRMAAIFTASVLARSGGKGNWVDVFVHDYEREAERVCSEEFLCSENMVFGNGRLSHFLIQSRRDGEGRGGEEDFQFCGSRDASSAAA